MLLQKIGFLYFSCSVVITHFCNSHFPETASFSLLWITSSFTNCRTQPFHMYFTQQFSGISQIVYVDAYFAFDGSCSLFLIVCCLLVEVIAACTCCMSRQQVESRFIYTVHWWQYWMQHRPLAVDSSTLARYTGYGEWHGCYGSQMLLTVSFCSEQWNLNTSICTDTHTPF